MMMQLWQQGQRAVARWLVAGATASVAACGGGGGGDDSMQVRFDTTVLSLEVQEGSAAGSGSRVIMASATGGSNNDAVYVGAEATGPGLMLPIDVIIDTVSRTATITVRPNPGLPAGSYSGNLRLLACKDPQCASQHRGSPHNVAYTTTVLPRFKVSASSLAFAAAETTAPAAQDLSTVLPRGASGVTASTNYGQGPAGWLDVRQAGGVFTVQPRNDLSAGLYNAQLELVAVGTGDSLTVPVSFSVSAGLVLPARVELALNGNSPASSAQGEFVVAVAPGLPATAWTASVDAAWVRLASTSGAPGEPLRWAMAPAGFAALANQSLHEATITVRGADGLSPQTVVMALSKDMPQIDSIDALAVLAGEPGEVLLHGRLFDQLTAPLQQVLANGFLPLSAQVRSAGLMSLQVPALAAGSYSISLGSAAGLPTRTVWLQVVAAQDHGHQYIATEGRKGALLWDAVTQTAFVRNQSLGSVMAFKLGGTLQAPSHTLTARSVAELRNIGLGPARDGLLAVTQSGTLLNLSTTDLSTLSTRSVGAPVTDTIDHLPLLVSGDNVLWLPSGVLAYDLTRSAQHAVPAGSFMFYGGPWGRVSGNGQRMLMVQSASITPNPPLLWRDTTDGALVPFGAGAPLAFFYRSSSDRRGTRFVVEDTVYNFDLTVHGRLPLPAGWYGTETAMSRDGSRVYLFARDELNTQSRIWVFDSSQQRVTTLDHPLLGYFEPWLNPSCSNQVQDDNCNSYGTRMVLTDDDRTIVAVGDRYLAVVPVPSNLRGGVLPAQVQRAPYRLPAR